MAETRIHVLLVEDNPSHAELVRSALARAALTVFDLTHVASLAAARASLATGAWDVVLLNLGLPDASGLAGLAAIREQCPDLAVVILTRNADSSLAVETAAAGALDYVYKGDMTAHLLERVLRHAVQRQQVLLEIRGVSESLRRKNVELEEVNKQLDRRNEELRGARDLLDQKNRRLARLNEMAQQFVDNVSHDFRTPLTVIKEYVSIVRDGLAGPVTEKQLKYLGIVDDRADDLAIMIDDMLDVSRLEAGLLSVWRRESRVHDVLGHVCPVLERKAATKNVSLEIVVEDDLPAVYCDPDKSGRVLTNLAVNAIKFCGSGGTVKVWAGKDADGSHVVIGVTDNGPGLSEDDLQSIFKRFHQIGHARRAGEKGFGLGLGIARDLARLNLSEIAVESEPGRGSTFSFRLPVYDSAALPGRYLDYLVQNDLDRSIAMSLIVVTADAPIQPTDSIMLDEFLQHTFRGTDFVVRTRPNKWLVLARCGDEVGRTLARVEDAWALTNRNMPGARLPRIGLEAKGTWSGESRDAKLLARCEAEFACPDGEPEGLKILVVDDDREFVEGLEIRLAAIGYRVLTAFDGQVALDVALRHRPDVLLMENGLPAMSGLEVLQRLRRCPDTANTAVVMLAASTQQREEALEQGVAFYLQKPCDFETLTAALREAIAQPCRAG